MLAFWVFRSVSSQPIAKLPNKWVWVKIITAPRNACFTSERNKVCVCA